MGRKFKTIRRYTIESPGKEIELSDEFLTNLSEFDDRGNVIKEVTYGLNGELEQLITYQYNEDNHIVEESHFNEDNDRTEHHSYERNADGSIHTEIISYMDGSVDTVSYTYDSRGFLLERIQIDDEDEEEIKEVRKYKDDLMTRLEISENNEQVSSIENAYNNDNQLAEKTEWNTEDDIEIKYKYVYEEGNHIKTSKFVDGKLTEISEFSYDENGRVEDIFEQDAYRKVKVSLEYDEKGNVVLQREESEVGELISKISRAFDEESNMLTSDVYIAARPDYPGRQYRVIYSYDFRD